VDIQLGLLRPRNLAPTRYRFLLRAECIGCTSGTGFSNGPPTTAGDDVLAFLAHACAPQIVSIIIAVSRRSFQ
jgi:hypothetical protein